MDSISFVAATGYCQFKINHTEIKDKGIGEWITTPQFHVSQHDWTIKYYPQGNDHSGKFVSVYLKLQRKSIDVSATFEFLLLDKHGNASETTLKRTQHTFTSNSIDWGFSRFIETKQLEKTYIKNDHFVLGVYIWVNDGSCRITFPYYVGDNSSTSSMVFLHKRVQKFREENKQTDVTFDVDGEKFVAHRLIMAAHSPVFEAELFGSMAESNLDCIIIKEMIPSVFKAMLDFMYDGSFYVIEELLSGDLPMPSVPFIQNLLMAADRYAVEQLKAMCEHKLVESITLDNVLSFLELAEKYTCGELKKACLQFVVDEDNSSSLMFNEGYIDLMHNYPSLLGELKEMAAK